MVQPKQSESSSAHSGSITSSHTTYEENEFKGGIIQLSSHDSRNILRVSVRVVSVSNSYMWFSPFSHVGNTKVRVSNHDEVTSRWHHACIWTVSYFLTSATFARLDMCILCVVDGGYACVILSSCAIYSVETRHTLFSPDPVNHLPKRPS